LTDFQEEVFQWEGTGNGSSLAALEIDSASAGVRDALVTLMIANSTPNLRVCLPIKYDTLS